MNTMVKAHLMGVIVPGREHHSHWFQDINHPDAKLIASSAELLDSLDRLIHAARSHVIPGSVLDMRVKESLELINNILATN